jgi:hypothetical protein
MQIKSISDFRAAVRNGPYAWPGGYPLYFVMADGEAIAWLTCATPENRRLMLEALRDKADFPRSEWLPVAVEINYEDGELICAHSNVRIESAYAEPEEQTAVNAGILVEF